jgi:hypothetical protein
MVDVKKIQQLLNKNFTIKGDAQIDSVTGLVNIQGHVHLMINLNEIPVQFGHVSGDFHCSNNSLKTLKGAPHSVGGAFYVNSNKLVSLEGSPHSVGGSFYCQINDLTSLKGSPHSVGLAFRCTRNPLISLEGSPHTVGRQFNLDYNKSLPLLRLLHYNQILLHQAPLDLLEILEKYAGTGKSHILLCSNELKNAGFKENAAW